MLRSLRVIACLLLALLALPLGGVGVAAAARSAKHGKQAKTAPALPPNTGAKGSRCKAAYAPGDLDSALDTTSLGVLPAAYEIGTPSGPVRRAMILVHGGGWYRVGNGMIDTERESADDWRKSGWLAVNTTYRACRHSLVDVLATYDAVRAKVGPDVPICLKGESAGAQLALMVAAERADVACVLAGAAPTDLWTVKSQGTRAGRADGAARVFGFARAAFGRDALRAMSPASNAASIHARVLLADAQDDGLIPNEQQQQLADQLRSQHPDAYVDVALLASGPNAFIHGSASDAALKDLQKHIVALVQPFGDAPGTPKFSLPAPKVTSGLTGLLKRIPIIGKLF